jgi:DNA topoisomerase-2
LIAGKYNKIADDKIQITELPVGTWTMPYITFLEGLMDGTVNEKTGKKTAPTIKDFTSISTELVVDIVVQFPKDELAKLEETIDPNGLNGVYKLLKLSTTITTTNMHMFNADRKLHKYATVEEIIDEFYGVRMKAYADRKAYMVADLQDQLKKLTNRAKYILENLNGEVDLRRKTAQQVAELLTTRKYDKIDNDYKYLTKMPMDSVTQENVDSILREKGETKLALDTLISTTIENMWVRELDAFVETYSKYKADRAQMYLAKPETRPSKPAKASGTAGTGVAKAGVVVKRTKHPINQR